MAALTQSVSTLTSPHNTPLQNKRKRSTATTGSFADSLETSCRVARSAAAGAAVRAHGKEWGSKFAGMAQHILQQLESGNASAVAEFMYNETLRVLNTVPALRV